MELTSLILSKKYVDDTLKGEGAIKGKSAYEIACDHGFKGTSIEWLMSLKGETPQISPAGTWIIGNVDTGIIASPNLAGYATEQYVRELLQELELPEGTLSMIALTREEILNICK